MFSKLAIVAATAFAVFAAASPTPGGGGGGGGGVSQCNTSNQYCCNSVQKASSPAAQGIIATLLGAIIDANANVGLTCSPTTIIGTSSNSCNQEPVCCNGNNFSGLLVVGCSPININL